MSVKALSVAFDESRATGAAFTVLLALADWADHNGRCYPSYGQIAAKARVSRATAIDAVQRLIALGELERVEQGKEPSVEDEDSPASTRSQWRNLYRIVLVKHRGQVVQHSDHLSAGAPSPQVVQQDDHQVVQSDDHQVVKPDDHLSQGSPAQVVQPDDWGGPIHTPQVVQSTDLHIRIRPSGRPSIKPSVLKAGAPPRPAEHADEKPDEKTEPEKNLGIITKLAHDTFALLGLQADLGEVADAVKAQCAQHGIAYWPGDVVRRAIDAAKWQRQHPASRRVEAAS